MISILGLTLNNFVNNKAAIEIHNHHKGENLTDYQIHHKHHHHHEEEDEEQGLDSTDKHDHHHHHNKHHLKGQSCSCSSCKNKSKQFSYLLNFQFISKIKKFYYNLNQITSMATHLKSSRLKVKHIVIMKASRLK